MDEGQKLVVRLVSRNGRRRFDPESKDRLIPACLEPGASVSKLAGEHGVNANLVGNGSEGILATVGACRDNAWHVGRGNR